MTKEEVQQLIREAILAERERLANKINCSSARYVWAGGDGDSSERFDWDETVHYLIKSILEDD